MGKSKVPVAEPVFKSVHAAVKFAVNYRYAAAAERSAMSKMMDPSRGGTGKGLVGLDGAAQAGMVLAEVKRLGPAGEGCVLARMMPRYTDCSCGAACCSGKLPNPHWHAAVELLSEELWKAMDDAREEGKRGPKNDPAMRRALVAKFFGAGIKVAEVAKASDVSEATVGNHRAFIAKVLKKAEGDAWNRLEDSLRASGMVGEM